MVDKFSSSAKLGIYVPKFNWQFKHYILHVARSYFSCGLVFNMQKVSVASIWIIPYLGLHLRSHLLGCLFLKYMLSPILKEVGVPSRVFCAVLKWFSSNIFLAMASVSLCASRFNIPESGSPKNHCMVSSSWCRGKFGSLPHTRKNRVSAVVRLGVICSWLELDLYIYPSYTGLFHRASSRLVSSICETPLICCCAVGGKVLKIFFQLLTVSVPDP